MTSPLDPHTKCYSHINGTAEELLDRLAVAELCKGWPVYRDASEWKNYRSLFTDDATVWTTWSGPQHVDDFIAISKAGKEQGVFIMHRECGTLVELNPARGRAIGKMKATITHRFTFLPPNNNNNNNNNNSSSDSDSSKAPPTPAEFDVDCDCRFIFFCEKQPRPRAAPGAAASAQPFAWKARYVKLFYEKDKVVPVDGVTAPAFAPAELAPYPAGYRHLGAAQARLGYAIDVHLPTAGGALFGRMYGEMEKWLEGGEVDLFWEEQEEEEEEEK
ncbi:hypothetical protein VTK26DRAFT_2376 [Humicola hyalothermophila]